MSIFGRLFGKQPSAERPQQQQPLQAVLAHLDGSRLPDHVYQECDLATIEDNVEVGTAGCAVRAATIPPAVSRAGTSQRDVPTEVTFMESPDAILGAHWCHEPGGTPSERGCVRSTSRSGLELRAMLRLGLRPQPRSVLFAFVILLFAGRLLSFAAESRLADAVEKSDRATIRALLKRHADINAPQADGMTALHWAAYRDDVKMAKLLVASGANAKAENRYGVTALSMACVNGNTELVELLLGAGADPNTTLRGRETVLMTAARTGKIGPVKALLARGADVNAKEKDQQTALMWAAAEGHNEVVELLLKAGADFRTTLPDSGFTPFFFAVREGRIGVVKALLKAGVDVNETMQPRKPSGKGPRKGTSALILAVENGHFELALALLEARADPNDQRSGFTALHAMTWVRKPNRGDGDDGDPSPIGSGNLSSLQFVKKLVEHGADVNARLKNGKGGPGLYNKAGATPFLMAAGTADAAFMRLLVELGANPLLGNVDNCTPLMSACGIGIGGAAADETAGTEPEVLEAAQLALDRGADVNAVDANGETAMHGAAYKNLPKVVQFLADKGAKIEVWNRTNKWGWTPLRIAEGYRPGNFKPSTETIAALHRVMLAAGVAPPTNAAPAVQAEPNYQADEAKKRVP